MDSDLIPNPFYKGREEYYLLDQVLNFMDRADFVNAGIQALATAFGAGAIAMYSSNFWYAVVSAVLCLGFYFSYELLP